MHDLTQLIRDEAFLIPIAKDDAGGIGTGIACATIKNIAWNNFGMYAFEDVWLDR